MNRVTKILSLSALAIFLSSPAFAAPSTSPPPVNVRSVTCDCAQIEWDVAMDAQVENFACAFGIHEGDPSLIFTLTLKNVSDQPQRFRVRIFLIDMDKAMGAFVPVKGTPPVLAPGEAAQVKLPFMKTTTMSKDIQVVVSPVAVD